jgi:hypothetical protein
MSQTEHDELAETSGSEAAAVGPGEPHNNPNTLNHRASSESNKSWPSISAFMSLIGGSRANQDNSEVNKENEKIDEELTW